VSNVLKNSTGAEGAAGGGSGGGALSTLRAGFKFKLLFEPNRLFDVELKLSADSIESSDLRRKGGVYEGLF